MSSFIHLPSAGTSGMGESLSGISESIINTDFITKIAIYYNSPSEDNPEFAKITIVLGKGKFANAFAYEYSSHNEGRKAFEELSELLNASKFTSDNHKNKPGIYNWMQDRVK